MLNSKFSKSLTIFLSVQIGLTLLGFLFDPKATFKSVSGWGSLVAAVLFALAYYRLFHQDSHSALDYEHDEIQRRRDDAFAHQNAPPSTPGILQRLSSSEMFTAALIWFVVTQLAYQLS